MSPKQLKKLEDYYSSFYGLEGDKFVAKAVLEEKGESLKYKGICPFCENDTFKKSLVPDGHFGFKESLWKYQCLKCSYDFSVDKMLLKYDRG